MLFSRSASNPTIMPSVSSGTSSIFSVVTGIILSYIFDITPSGAIVLLLIAIFAATLGIKSTGLIAKLTA